MAFGLARCVTTQKMTPWAVSRPMGASRDVIGVERAVQMRRGWVMVAYIMHCASLVYHLLSLQILPGIAKQGLGVMKSRNVRHRITEFNVRLYS